MKDDRRGRFAFCTASLVVSLILVLLGCGRESGKEDAVLAKVGAQELTRHDLAQIANMPVDSLSAAQRWQLVQAWIESQLVIAEGQRRKLDHDGEIAGKLAAVRTELYRSKLLSEMPSHPPSDSVVSAYYAVHRLEFLRPVDAFSLDLFWAEHRETIAKFRDQFLHGDTTMLKTGDVNSEGRWLAEAGELPADLEKELASMQPGEVTFPRPYEDGFRVARLLDVFPAGKVLDLSAVRDEITERLLLEQSRARQDSLLAMLRGKYPVKIFLRDSL
jgi:hypothetical protein